MLLYKGYQVININKSAEMLNPFTIISFIEWLKVHKIVLEKDIDL
jgi:hypothetical protein